MKVDNNEVACLQVRIWVESILRAICLWCSVISVPMLTGCAYTGSVKDYLHNGLKVGPEYRKPAAPVSDEWIDSFEEHVRTELPNYADWWTAFNDPILNDLMEEAYQQNLTLRVAGLRVLQARYIRAIAVGSFFPQQQEAFGSYSRIQSSENVMGGMLPRSRDLWTVGFDSFWEIDTWGKFRRNIESADASLDATVEDYDAALVSLLGETATAYIDLRTAQQRLAYAKSNVEIQTGSLKLAEARVEAGAAGQLDKTQAETVLANTQQLIPLFENQMRAANNSLCVLLGRPPQDLTEELGEGPIPTLPNEVVVGVPANLLRRRPDVRAAERRVAAQSARIGVAAADLLPHFSIVGAISLDSEQFSDLFTSASTAGAISPGFNWDILNYGRLINNVNLQDAAFKELAVQYQQTVLDASAEVENSMNGFLKSKERLIYVNRAVKASESSVNLAMIQYGTGAVNFNRVFNLQTSLVSDQDTLAVVQGDAARSVVATYKALGGGWEIRYGIRRGGLQVAMEEVPAPQPGVISDGELVAPVPIGEPIELSEDQLIDNLSPEMRQPENSQPENSQPKNSQPEDPLPANQLPAVPNDVLPELEVENL